MYWKIFLCEITQQILWTATIYIYMNKNFQHKNKKNTLPNKKLLWRQYKAVIKALAQNQGFITESMAQNQGLVIMTPWLRTKALLQWLHGSEPGLCYNDSMAQNWSYVTMTPWLRTRALLQWFLGSEPGLCHKEHLA